MDRQRKERLVGAAVLIMLAVIFIPMVLDDSVQPETGITGTNIPPRPEGEFASRVIPLTSSNSAGRETDTEVVAATPPPGPAVALDKPRDEVVPPANPGPPAPTPAAPATLSTPAASTSAIPEQVPAKSPNQDQPANAGPVSPVAVGVAAWVVQLGSFANAENAEALNKKLRLSGYAAFVEPLQQDGAKVFKVRVGPELRRSSAQSLRDRLQASQGLDGIVVPYP